MYLMSYCLLSVVDLISGHGGSQGAAAAGALAARTGTQPPLVMSALARPLVYLLFCFKLAAATDPPCIIELECEECVPTNMPLVTSHRAANGSVVAASGDEVVLSCGDSGKFAAYPLQGVLAAACEAGRYRVRHDAALRHLLDLGCQENVFEDVLHQVEQCGPPLQGRAYQVQEGGRTRHVATLCFDADRGLATRARATNAPRGRLPLAPHAHAPAPLSLLGNFNHLFDARTRLAAERLYADAARLNRRLHELFKHDRVSFARQTLTSAKLLSDRYFDDQNVRVTDFVSNEFAAWQSVAEGNLRHLHRDVAKLMSLARPHATLDVYAGTSGVMSLRTGRTRTEVYLEAGRRFPVPKYVWTVVHDPVNRRGLAVVVLNDPFVAVSEIREAVFCDSACGQVPWLHELRRNRNYESPVLGLVFCCSLSTFTSVVTEMPKDIVKDVKQGAEGMIIESYL